MTPVRLEPAALRSRVKHSTTEPLRSHNTNYDQEKMLDKTAEKSGKKKLIRISVGIPYHFAMCIYLKCIDHTG